MDARRTFQLSPVQQGMVFQSLYTPNAGIYVQQYVVDFDEALNIPKFWRAWQLLVELHPLLRASFDWDEQGRPLGYIHARVDLPLAKFDVRHLSATERQDRISAYLEEDRQKGFDFQRPPLLRLAIFRLEEAAYRLVHTVHHAISDGRTSVLLFKDVFTFYDDLQKGRQPTLGKKPSYENYIEWLAQQDLDAGKADWQTLLSGIDMPTPMGMEHPAVWKPGQGMPSPAHREIQRHLSPELSTALADLARQNGLTLNTLAQGAWALLLYRYTAIESHGLKLETGIPVVFGATHNVCHFLPWDASQVAGPLLNTLPVAAYISPDQRLLLWLNGLRQQWLDMRPYQHTPLGHIMSWCKQPPDRQLFESLVNYDYHTLDEALRLQGVDVQGRRFQLLQNPAYPITLSVFGSPPDPLFVSINYDPQRLSDETAAAAFGHLETLWTEFIKNPQRRLRDFPILTPPEYQHTVVEWNATSRDYPRQESIATLFERQAARTPRHEAVIYDQECLNYTELNQRANRLAHYLIQSGVEQETPVAVFLERSPELIVSMLAILKAGGTCVPLDTTYPAQRLALMIEDTRVTTLITCNQLLDRLPGYNGRLIFLDRETQAIARNSPANPGRLNHPESLAYIIYTSGSTGRPKGIDLPQRAILRLVCNSDYLQVKQGERVAQVSNISFDAAIFEVWSALLNGGCLAGIQRETMLNPPDYKQALAEQRIDHVLVTTALFNQLAALQPDTLQSVKTILTGGESVTPTWVKRVRETCDAPRLLHVYGPTESATLATWFEVERVATEAGNLPIGRPIANTQVYVLDAGMLPLPPGIVGELYIGGDGLARGYHRLPGLTADRFVPAPFGPPGSRLYRTGDLVRQCPDGNIEFIGRADAQVKLRGFRIELGEIEAALLRQPEVAHAAVLLFADAEASGGASIPVDRRLIAYIVPAHQDQQSALTEPGQLTNLQKSLRSALRSLLPEYMIPADLVFLDELPFTPNGKIDRQVLLETYASRRLVAPNKGQMEMTSGSSSLASGDVLEQKIAAIFAQVFGLEKVDPQANFFDIGGHSLLAIQIISRLHSLLQVNVPLRWLFEYQTPSDLAGQIRNALAGATPQSSQEIEL